MNILPGTTAAPSCTTCGAQMTAGSAFCLFCGQRSLIAAGSPRDFYRFEHGRSMRCPACQAALEVRATGDVAGLSVGHCTACKGMFFPPGVVEHVLKAVCGPALSEDTSLLRRMRKQLKGTQRPSGAQKCPVCDKAMPAAPYSTVFPLQLERCEEHGVWMQHGQFELLRLWRDAGGYLADPHLSGRLLALELEIGARRVVMWLLLAGLVAMAGNLVMSQYALKRADAYTDCSEAFDRKATDGSAPDFGLRRAKAIDACAGPSRSPRARADEAVYQEVLAALPHAPCRYVGVWIAATNGTSQPPATVDDALAAARVTLNGDGSFLAEPLTQSRGARPARSERGHWGANKNRLIFLRNTGFTPPEVDTVSEAGDSGFLLKEGRGGRAVRYLLQSRAAPESGCAS